MKIIIALLVPILMGIVVGSNLLPTMTVIILNQPTIALPIGVWLIIAIGLGLLSSIAIQVLISIDRRSLKRQIRQLQSRSPQDEDVFTYTPQATRSSASSAKTAGEDPANQSPAAAKPSRFKSYRSTFAQRFTPQRSTSPNVSDDRDDWGDSPVTNRQLDWEDSPPPRSQNRQSAANRYPVETDDSPDRSSQSSYAERGSQRNQSPSPATSREVYDADFRLIQPPYKQPLETEFDDDLDADDFEYEDTDRAADKSRSSVTSSPNRSTPTTDLDDEDWGFDFESRDTPAKAN
ncbi:MULTISPECIES: hypothetical protein [unclassified Chamaesiphon]|uniref:hypothetical protein n=1 Tax=unclassified Chamaesiphon TaxID=2620921 RepID=UPI00286D09B8|nr:MULTISPECIES: hypothetical protein [unclassified Chamaesiphon]